MARGLASARTVSVRSLRVLAARHRTLRLLTLGGLVVGGWLLGALSGAAHAETAAHPMGVGPLRSLPGAVAVQDLLTAAPPRSPVDLRIPERSTDPGSAGSTDADAAVPPAEEPTEPTPPDPEPAPEPEPEPDVEPGPDTETDVEPEPSTASPRTAAPTRPRSAAPAPPLPAALTPSAAASTPALAAGKTRGEARGEVCDKARGKTRDGARPLCRPARSAGQAKPRSERPDRSWARTDAPSPPSLRGEVSARAVGASPSGGVHGDVLGGYLHQTPGLHAPETVSWPPPATAWPLMRTDVEEPPPEPD